MSKHRPKPNPGHTVNTAHPSIQPVSASHPPTEPQGLKRRHFMGTALALDAAALLAACGGGSSSGSADASAPAGDVSAAPAEGAMSDPSFAVQTYLDTMWPIEGNDYAQPDKAKAWCAQFTSDKAGAVAAVAADLGAEPDIAVADPGKVSAAIEEYLTNNCEYVTP